MAGNSTYFGIQKFIQCCKLNSPKQTNKETVYVGEIPPPKPAQGGQGMIEKCGMLRAPEGLLRGKGGQGGGSHALQNF